MQKTLLLKALSILLLALLLMVPLAMIHGLVLERQNYLAQATVDIANSYAGAQTLIGPVLIVPYEEEYRANELDPKTEKWREVWRRQAKQVLIFPDTLNLSGTVDTSVKKRGLFPARVFAMQAHVSGTLTMPAELTFERREKDSRIIVGQAYVSLGVSDPRGLAGAPQLEIDGTAAEFAQGAQLGQHSGIHAPLAITANGKPQTLPYTLKLDLTGTERIGFVPLAGDTRIDLQSSWPHPSFSGRFLPDPKTQSVTDSGFSAKWRVASLATSAQQQLMQIASGTACRDSQCLDTLDVRFLDPVNIYTQADRAIKYDILFVGLTFAAFFLFEVMKRLPVHPAQYTLVGLALAMFFLLLLALSEHMAFDLAYLIAASACVGLVSFYLAGVLGGWRRGAGFGALLATLYGALFGLLNSEDNALLMGALLLFGVLGLAMWLTRRFDWYALTLRATPTPTQAQSS
ncbi:MAG: cell envelope integrity protein CreD [Sterolibacteriaceae bacterium]|uniref:Cell envelope integrity protein CreD n=1 Tax=Candidatus Methylophosphatis roskildensis TaxID=2899263 RepID=A0A9D7E4H4_9PROT|nr:cell envelope integrity protein CreD [Candidatus Methylophosphatis roskildensis]MBK7234623.1 cell envelope integrity protein CreD [Sterolibacteriaceae bacterium]